MSEPYKDPDWLYEKYVEGENSMRKVADMAGVSVATIHTRLNEYDIESRTKGHKTVEVDYPHAKLPGHLTKDVAEELYNEQDLSTIDIAEVFDVHPRTVQRRFHALDIELDDNSYDYAPYRVQSPSKGGYTIWQTSHNCETFTVLVHRLTAVAEYGFEAVADKQVHHRNNIPFDNRPENLKPVTSSEHGRIHAAIDTYEGTGMNGPEVEI